MNCKCMHISSQEDSLPVRNQRKDHQSGCMPLITHITRCGEKGFEFWHQLMKRKMIVQYYSLLYSKKNHYMVSGMRLFSSSSSGKSIRYCSNAASEAAIAFSARISISSARSVTLFTLSSSAPKSSDLF